jgi:hypothetical protein
VRNAKAVAVGSVSGLGWHRRGEAIGEAAYDQDLPAEREEDPKIPVGVRIAMDRLGFEVPLIELGRCLRLGCVDVDVIERFYFHGLAFCRPTAQSEQGVAGQLWSVTKNDLGWAWRRASRWSKSARATKDSSS